MNDRRAFFRTLASAAREVATADQPTPAHELPVATDAWLDRYSRQLVLPEWSEAAQRALASSSS